MFYKCLECGCIHKTKVEECDGCREKEFEEFLVFTIDDIANLIRDYSFRGEKEFDVCVDYWDLYRYIEGYIGNGVYIVFDKAFKKAEEKGFAIKRELVFFFSRLRNYSHTSLT